MGRKKTHRLLLLMKRVSYKNDNSTLRFYANSAKRYCDACSPQSVCFKFAVWLPLRVFEQLARFARSPTYAAAQSPHCYCTAFERLFLTDRVGGEMVGMTGCHWSRTGGRRGQISSSSWKEIDVEGNAPYKSAIGFRKLLLLSNVQVGS